MTEEELVYRKGLIDGLMDSLAIINALHDDATKQLIMQTISAAVTNNRIELGKLRLEKEGKL